MRFIVDTVTFLLAVVGAHTVLNGIFAWAVRRGWLYDKMGKRIGSNIGNVILHVEGIIEPRKRAVVEAKRQVGEQQVADGEPEGSAKKNVYFELRP